MFMFWERVTNLRETLSMSIGDLLDTINKSRSTWNDWLKFNRIPPGNVCVKIAEALGTTVEYLITGRELPLDDDDDAKPPGEIHLPNGDSVTSNGEEPTIVVPVAPQRISAGNGEEFLPASQFVGKIRILERMARGIDRAHLIAAQVKGDSMTGVQIFEGDLVVFAMGVVMENGLYVVSMRNDVLVKRLEFNPITNEVRIISENPRYAPIVTQANDDNLRILGKVVGWIHVHPY